MTFACIAAARRFDAAAHVPFAIAGRQVGWLRRGDVARLARWPDVFEFPAGRVELAARYDSVDARSMALASPIGALAAEGAIVGWRDEIYAIRNRFDDPPLAYIERAASRFFGTMTYAVHLNGIVEYAPSAPLAMWLGRRSATKATDPGMLDNVVAGGIGWGLGIEDTIAKECWEEAGIAAELAARARFPAASRTCSARCRKARKPSRSSSTTCRCRAISCPITRTAKSPSTCSPASTRSSHGCARAKPPSTRASRCSTACCVTARSRPRTRAESTCCSRRRR
ncbi:NUDIX domain protein [Burkholderia pseudomallei]|nr:NUDIX domain protein [Burkholderia pseudomallei]